MDLRTYHRMPTHMPLQAVGRWWGEGRSPLDVPLRYDAQSQDPSYNKTPVATSIGCHCTTHAWGGSHLRVLAHHTLPTSRQALHVWVPGGSCSGLLTLMQALLEPDLHPLVQRPKRGGPDRLPVSMLLPGGVPLGKAGFTLPHRAGSQGRGMPCVNRGPLPPLTVASVAPCLPGHRSASLGRGLSPAYDGIHASDRTSLNSCRTFCHASPASWLMNNCP